MSWNTVEIEITSKKDRKSYFGIAITDVMTGLLIESWAISCSVAMSQTLSLSKE